METNLWIPTTAILCFGYSLVRRRRSPACRAGALLRRVRRNSSVLTKLLRPRLAPVARVLRGIADATSLGDDLKPRRFPRGRPDVNFDVVA
jgi:hypothetical protein